MSKTHSKDTNFKSPNKMTLKIHLFSTENYFGHAHLGLIERAETMLREHGLELHCFLSKTPQFLIDLRGSGNGALFLPTDFEAIKARVDEVMGFNKTSTTHLGVVFCNFAGSDHGLTPGKERGWNRPLCLISPTPNKDQVTLLHEMGHAADVHHDEVEHEGKRNFMDRTEPRTLMYRDQIEALAKCFFAGK